MTKREQARVKELKLNTPTRMWATVKRGRVVWTNGYVAVPMLCGYPRQWQECPEEREVEVEVTVRVVGGR